MKVDRPDVAHWLIQASLKKGTLEEDREWLNGDAVTIIIAGRLVPNACSCLLSIHANDFSYRTFVKTACD
jgi:hypothetical protein